MKKFIALFLAVIMLLSLAACDNRKPDNNTPGFPESNKHNYNSKDLKSILSYIKTAGETACADTETEAKALVEKLGDSYNTYSKNKDSITSFYDTLHERSESLYKTFQSCSIDYFIGVAAQGLDDYDTWDDAMGEFYDEWDDIMGEYYDTWDDAMGDVYDQADDLISDAADELDYDEYSDEWSSMYAQHSDTWSALYKLYSDAWSKTYKEYSSCWSGFYKGNADVDAILAEAAKEGADAPENITQPTDPQETNTTSSNDDADEIRPEFKAAMDAYEAFYDEYCNILKKYYANPTDMSLLAEYTELMKKAVDVDEAFAKWENENLNTEELKYYLDVHNRVMQKLLDVMG